MYDFFFSRLWRNYFGDMFAYANAIYFSFKLKCDITSLSVGCDMICTVGCIPLCPAKYHFALQNTTCKANTTIYITQCFYQPK